MKGELEGRWDPDMALYSRKVQHFNFPIVILKNILKEQPKYGANEAGIERLSENEVRYIRITDIDDYGLLKKGLGVTASIIESQYELRNNDFLFARSGATAGKAFLFKKELVQSPCIYAGYMIRFRLDENYILPDYFFFYTQLDVYKEWVRAIQRAAGQPNINAEEYKSLKIPLPPLAKQQYIVDIMETAYAAKKTKEAEASEMLAGIDTYLLAQLGITLPEAPEKQTTFFVCSEKVSGGRWDPKKQMHHSIAWKKAIETSSKYDKLKLKTIVVNGAAGDWGLDEEDNAVTALHQKALIIRATEFDNIGNLNLDGSRIKFRMIHCEKLKQMNIQTGDLLIEKSGGSENQPVGRISIIEQDMLDNYTIAFSNFIHKISINTAVVLPTYLFYYLKLIHNLKITDAMQSQTNGIRNLIMQEYLYQTIIVPPLTVQNEIAAHITDLRNKAATLRAEALAGLEAAKAEIEGMILGGV